MRAITALKVRNGREELEAGERDVAGDEPSRSLPGVRLRLLEGSDGRQRLGVELELDVDEFASDAEPTTWTSPNTTRAPMSRSPRQSRRSSKARTTKMDWSTMSSNRAPRLKKSKTKQQRPRRTCDSERLAGRTTRAAPRLFSEQPRWPASARNR
jgi:hypothetical protein